MPNLPVTYKIETGAGPILPTVGEDREIEVDMGYPIFKASEIPTTLPSNFPDDGVVDQDIVVDSRTFQCSLVSMGNPHCVVFTDPIIEDDDLTFHQHDTQFADFMKKMKQFEERIQTD